MELLIFLLIVGIAWGFNSNQNDQFKQERLARESLAREDAAVTHVRYEYLASVNREIAALEAYIRSQGIDPRTGRPFVPDTFPTDWVNRTSQ